MQSRLDIILETVDMILEGSKRKWSKEKRLMHAKGTATAAYARYKREKGKADTYYMRNADDLGERGHRVNLLRYDARRRMRDMPGTEDQLTATPSGVIPALDAYGKAAIRVGKMNMNYKKSKA